MTEEMKYNIYGVIYSNYMLEEGAVRGPNLSATVAAESSEEAITLLEEKIFENTGEKKYYCRTGIHGLNPQVKETGFKTSEKGVIWTIDPINAWAPDLSSNYFFGKYLTAIKKFELSKK